MHVAVKDWPLRGTTCMPVHTSPISFFFVHAYDPGQLKTKKKGTIGPDHAWKRLKRNWTRLRIFSDAQIRSKFLLVLYILWESGSGTEKIKSVAAKKFHHSFISCTRPISLNLLCLYCGPCTKKYEWKGTSLPPLYFFSFSISWTIKHLSLMMVQEENDKEIWRQESLFSVLFFILGLILIRN